MDARQILAQARLAGLKVEIEEGKLAVSPASRLSDSLRDSIRENKERLIELLSQAPTNPDDGWDRMRRAGARLGESVSDGLKQYQLWGVTPRGAICFDGRVFRTLDFEEVGL